MYKRAYKEARKNPYCNTRRKRIQQHVTKT